VRWQAEFLQGLVQGLHRPRRLAPIARRALMSLQATAWSGFRLLFGVSFAEGHSVLLLPVLLARHGQKETMSPKAFNGKNLHGPQTVALRRELH
jgi:hypothetical protein